MSDLEILFRFRNGDEDAFKLIFGMFYKRLCFFASGISEVEGCNDIVQDAFVKLWERRTKFDRIDSIKSFLYQTVKNTCINIYKHKQVVLRHIESTYDPVEEINIFHSIIEAEVAGEIQKAIQKLAPGYQKVIYLSYFQGMSNQEVADSLEVSINTVKTQKLRALQQLKLLIKRPFVFIMLLF